VVSTYSNQDRPENLVRFGQHHLLMVLAVLTPLLVMLAMLTIGYIQNRDADRHARTQAHVVIDVLKGEMAAVAKDNAHWDGAYKAAALNPGDDDSWLFETWGVVTDGVAVYDQFFLLGPKAQMIFGASNGVRLPIGSLPITLDLQAKIVAMQRKTGPHEEPHIFLATHAGMPTIIVMDDAEPTTVELRDPQAPQRTLVFMRQLDAKAIAKAGQNSGLEQLKFVSNSNSSTSVFSLTDDEGKVIGTLQWKAATPGTKLMLFSGLGLMPILLLFALITWRTVRQSRADQLGLIASEARAYHMANHDGLTSLPNRRAFTEYLTSSLSRGQICAVLYVDLDGFKLINDSLCHDAGDAVLKEAGARLSRFLEGEDMLARLGGDEFALLLTGDDAPARSLLLAPGVIAALEQPFDVAGLKMHVGASVGLAHGLQNTSAAELMRQADIAMYAVKSDGKNGWQLFAPEMDEGRTLRTELESELRDAVANDEIYVVYQPIVLAETQRIVGVEALARWNNPARGAVGPDVFIPIAESSGLIITLGRNVLRAACLAAKDWDINLAVNLSPAQLRHAGLIEDVQAILAETGFPAHRLELELTEGVLIQSPDAAQKAIVKLRQLGIRISLDDFGTGYASIGYLRRFTLDKIKIDRSFVDRVALDYSSASITNAIIALANALSLPITAEGVENKDQATILRIAGCTQFQGWLFGKPMRRDQLGDRLAQQNGAPEQLSA
jgi:diguanylate cyclase (GGDEF)-like protein